MKTTLFSVVIAALLCIFTSCSKDNDSWTKFECINVQTRGITLTPAENGFCQRGVISADGANFSILPDQDSNVAGIGQVWINGELQDYPDDFSGEPPFLLSRPVLQGDWGEIKYGTENSSFVIDFSITKNTSSESRVFKFVLGGGYYYVDLEITQEAAK